MFAIFREKPFVRNEGVNLGQANSFRVYSLKPLFSIVSIAIFGGCASGPNLDGYPRREIDRPYTLPHGVAAWHIPTITGIALSSRDSIFVPPIPVPLIWEQSLSNDWNLIWFPLPLGVSHQFVNDQTQRTGFTFLNGFVFGSSSGVRYKPNFMFSYRSKLSKDLALELTPSVALDLSLKSGQELGWNAGFRFGPLFQTSDFFALKPSVSIAAIGGWSPELFANSNQLRIRERATYSLGLGIESIWSFARQWDLRPSYAFSSFGTIESLRTHLVSLDFVHFW